MFRNRIGQLVLGWEPEQRPGEYIVIGGSFGTFLASRKEGARVAGLLERWWTPRWIEFEDTSGSRVRVRSRDINEIYDLAPGIRHAARAIRRAHAQEEAEERCSWEDDES